MSSFIYRHYLINLRRQFMRIHYICVLNVRYYLISLLRHMFISGRRYREACTFTQLVYVLT